ncbi:MAG: Immunoglobulin subtype, partial [Pedosphaera sp.]|nr:Immunoglobulin subtype [Pedosphaera sp.]
TWTVTTNDSLIAGEPPSNTSGNFSMEVPGRSVNSLTTGGSGSLTQLAATMGYTTSTNYVTCGNGGGAGSLVVYTLTGSASGYSLTNIMVYGGWVDAGRDQQAYTVYYSTMAAPATFYLLGSVNYNPSNPANVQSATRAMLRPSSGALATNVATVKFDFSTPASENGFCGYSQIQLFGTPTQVVAPPATNPTNLLFLVSADSLMISWPNDHTGWRLQCQTNNLDVGIGTNWFDVAGSTVTNQMSLPINPGNCSVFYRLLYP